MAFSIKLFGRRFSWLPHDHTAERQLKLLVEGVTDYAIYMLDPNGRVTTWNAGAERIKGYSANEIIGQSFERFFAEEDRAAGVPGKLLDRARETGRYESEGVRLRKDGSRFRSHAVVNALHDSAGRLVGFAKITRDITARVEAEKSLRHVQEQLAQSQKMESLGQLTGGMAHDFNNALAIILSALQLGERAIDRGDMDRVRRFIADAIESAQHAGELVHRLLAFSRQQPLSPKPLDVNGLVRNMSEILRRTLGEHVQVETVLAGGLWNIKADQNQLENALINLATNARDALPEGGRLTIETSNAHLDDHYAAEHMNVPPGQYVLLAVSDTGLGMTSEQIGKAFEPFFTTKGAGRGTGLGLAQVYGFLKQSGGHARIYSEVGHGTTVKLYFPRYVGALERETITDSTTVPLGTQDEVILVVEDQPGVRKLAAQGLRELGYTVLEAEGADTALEILRQRDDVALLFTDVVMPDLDGRKLADAALEFRPGLKVLFTTGFTRNAIIHKGTIDPNTNFIAKPFKLEELARKVREALTS
jgi:PAS domain S-box-containing protein